MKRSRGIAALALSVKHTFRYANLYGATPVDSKNLPRCQTGAASALKRPTEPKKVRSQLFDASSAGGLIHIF
jgi:hypothetical protein